MEQHEGEPTPIEFPPPMVELFIHNGALEVQKVPTPTGEFNLVRLITPAIVFTIRLDESGTDALVNALKGPGAPIIQIAGAHEIPNLRT